MENEVEAINRDRWGPKILAEYRKADKAGKLARGDTLNNFEEGFAAAVSILERLEDTHQKSQEEMARLILTIEAADVIIYRAINMMRQSGYGQKKDSLNPIEKWLYDAMNYKARQEAPGDE